MILGRDKLSESAVRNHENGTNGIPASVAEAYAIVLKTTPDLYVFDKPTAAGGVVARLPQMAPMRQVDVIGDVRAGYWQSVRFVEDDEPEEKLSIDLPQFARAQLFGLRVIGNSMDREYPDGTRVVICPAVEIGVREGDHVIVRRRRGDEVETTIKEVALETNGLALWPRSTDPAHQSPIRVRPDRESDDGVEIIGVVVASYRVRQAQQGPLVVL